MREVAPPQPRREGEQECPSPLPPAQSLRTGRRRRPWSAERGVEQGLGRDWGEVCLCACRGGAHEREGGVAGETGRGGRDWNL